MKTPKPISRYEIHDRKKTSDSQLTAFNWRNPRFVIIDRTTGSAVDEAQSRYEARQILKQLSPTDT